MQQVPEDHHDIPAVGPTAAGGICVDFGRSAMRLSAREWVVVGFVLLICIAGIPPLWKRYEPFTVPPAYRIPYALSEDYWTYHRMFEQIAESDRIPVIGDSFVWGEYVSADETFSSDLNAETESDRFANAGLNGAHPLALQGLIGNYADNLRNRRILLHCNLLWMSSPERDLQSDNDAPFNHPRLVPQFSPRIPSYKAPVSQRLGTQVDRAIPFFGLVNHVRIYDFEGRDLHTWSIENPYENPLSQIQRRPLSQPEEPRHKPVPWTKQGIERQDWEWIGLDSSFQWGAWRRTVERLRSEGNRVFVIVGPFNEHLLQDPSRRRFEARKQHVEAWLQKQGIPYIAPALLPSEEYGDASHPLSAGYARLAKSIAANRDFREWLNGQ